MSSDARVEAAVAEFASRPGLPGWDPVRAAERCHEQSRRFIEVLATHGVTGELVSGFQLGDFMGQPVVTRGHLAVRVGDIVYDWTARQFDPGAEVPRTCSVGEWEQTWRRWGRGGQLSA